MTQDTTTPAFDIEAMLNEGLKYYESKSGNPNLGVRELKIVNQSCAPANPVSFDFAKPSYSDNSLFLESSESERKLRGSTGADHQTKKLEPISNPKIPRNNQKKEEKYDEVERIRRDWPGTLRKSG